MFLLRPLSTKTPNIKHRTTITTPLSFFSHSTLIQPHPQFKVEEEETITNRSYWSSKIHRLCSVDHNVDEALSLIGRLRLKGYKPDSLNLSSVIHALCHSNRFSEAHDRLLVSLSSGFVPDERTCNVIIARLLNSRNPYATLRVIRSLIAEKPEFVPSLVNYNRLMDQFCDLLRPLQAHALFLEMKMKGHCHNVVTYTTLINGYGKIGEVGAAHKLFDEMSVCKIQPNSLTYSVLIRGVLRKYRDIECLKEMISELWRAMALEKDPSVNNAAFANLIDSLCREGFFQEVFRIAEDNPQGESVDEEFAYVQLIDSLCKAKRYNGAARIVYIMRKRGLKPSLVSYNAIVHGTSKEGCCLRAYQLLEEGMEFGYFPSEYTYKVLVEALCRDSEICKAREVLRVMLKKAGVDGTRIYNIYLRAHCLVKNKNPSELLNILVEMIQKQCPADVITLNTVINGFCKIGKMEEALKILHDMIIGKFCAPNSVTFTTIISGFLCVGIVKEALDLFNKTMPENGLSVGVVTYNAVLRGLFKLNRTSEAMEVYKCMVSRNVIADSTTYAIIIDGLCQSCDRIDKVKRFWDDVIWPSKVHDNFVYAAILKGLCRFGKLNEACDFLYELVDSGVNPNVVSYNIVIDSACKLGLKRDAYGILKEMRKNGLTPDFITWRILNKLHGNVRKQVSVEGSSLEPKESFL